VKKYLILISLSLVFYACEKQTEPSTDATELSEYVNPYIGTGGHGHTYPGATVPFGMIQLSPDSRLEGWDGCGGYHYTDSIVYGFTHTHLSGTGIPDYGDVLLMPTIGDIKWDNGYKTGAENGYASHFDHDKEVAKAGYYSVELLDYGIDVELTVTKRAGFHKYTFPVSDEANVMLDLEHRDRLLDTEFQVLSSTTFRGKRFSKEWADNQMVYFYGEFSKPFDTTIVQSNPILEQNNASKPTKAAFSFKTTEGEEIMLRIGISSVSMEGAQKNLEAEIDHWDFEKTKSDANDVWNKALSKITIKGGTKDKKTIFYTSLYHSMLNPNLFMDVDGQYLGTDMKVHTAEDYNNYTIFSLWDTYRATHPLFTIIEREKTRDFIRTFLNHYKHGGQLPVWELAANYTGTMIGYHSVSVIADAYAKGITDFDTALALAAMKHSANQNHLGLDALKKEGYIPADHESESVSKTLEYAYDDWCIARFAKAIGSEDDYKTFQKRSQYYKNMFDPTEGFMRAKMYNIWFAPFDPAEVNFNFTEANSWQYSFAVQQDIGGMVDLFGGKDKFDKKLDLLFETEMELSGRHQVDITGLIGQYAHGNEPSHHMAYLYNYIGKPWKSQYRVNEILRTMYQNEPDGLSGNEDCGQMSAWYVLSAMGFYSVTPGHDYYAIGTPGFEEATINLENDTTFTIRANNLSDKNFYIQSASLNGKQLNEAFLFHSDIMKGGELVFEMGPDPNKNWGTEVTVEMKENSTITPVPFILAESRTFIDELKIEIQSIDSDSKIYFSLDGSKVSEKSTLYTEPIILTDNTVIRAVAIKDGKSSFPIDSEFFKIDGGRSISLNTEYANQYAAGGPNALIDYMTGTNNYRTGAWQGFEGKDLIAVVDLGKEMKPSSIAMGFLQDVKSWVWYPKSVKFEVSKDGENFTEVSTIKNKFSDSEYGAFTQNFKTKVSGSFRYVKVTAVNYGKCPDWHLGAGGDTWLFADEISIK
jgi:predicted alpha-1,2-mannosidase